MDSVFVAVTDYDWHNHLAHHPELTDVNFWSPSPRRLAMMEPDTPVLFKLKARYGSRIVGGGFFVHFSVMPIALAWDVFGQANGASTLAELTESHSAAVPSLSETGRRRGPRNRVHGVGQRVLRSIGGVFAGADGLSEDGSTGQGVRSELQDSHRPVGARFGTPNGTDVDQKHSERPPWPADTYSPAAWSGRLQSPGY